jgi:LacI family transcriptional regulator
MVAKRSDVANLAGTSPAVVSYVLNNGPRPVAPATRERVLRAVEQLGYRPNRVASSLRTKKSMTLGLIVPDNMNPYFAELASAIEDAAFAAGYTLIMGNATDSRDRELAYVRAFLDRRVDGIALIPSSSDVSCAREIAESETPWVSIDRDAAAPSALARIVPDNFEGGRLATEHLIGHGRTRIACIAGPMEASNTAKRVDGWRQALDDAGLIGWSPPVRHVPFGKFPGREAALELLKSRPDTDAIFVCSDEQATGVLHALTALGRACPDDVALVSFDGIAASLLTTPGLSTVRQPRDAIAALAVKTLVNHDPQTPPEPGGGPEIVLPVELILRGSCGCPDPIVESPVPGSGARRESRG